MARTSAKKSSGKKKSQAKTKAKPKAKAKVTPRVAKAKTPAKTKAAKAKPIKMKARPKPVKPKVKVKAKVKVASRPSAVKKAAVVASKKTEVVKSSATVAKPTTSTKLKKTESVERVPQQVVAASVQTKKRGSRPKLLEREFLEGLTQAIRTAVLPLVLAGKGREVIGSAVSGDATFQLDKVAEKALLNYLRDARMPVAYYSEDSGYTTFTGGQPQHLLVVDPIDGTRAAKSGFEGCVVSVAATSVIERPRMVDVDSACVSEIVGNRMFYAERGKGARIYVDGQYRKPKLSKNHDLVQVSWSMTVPARPAELIFPTAAKFIDLTSLKGGFFACNSTSFSLTRLLTNQLDACVDFANRYLRDLNEVVQDHFINAGRGKILGIAPYDMAASVLIAQEAGCTVTDAYGASFDEVLLLDSGVLNQQSMIAASNPELHHKLMEIFDTRIKQFELLLKRRAELAAQGPASNRRPPADKS